MERFLLFHITGGGNIKTVYDKRSILVGAKALPLPSDYIYVYLQEFS